jgi:hypothetical protein
VPDCVLVRYIRSVPVKLPVKSHSRSTSRAYINHQHGSNSPTTQAHIIIGSVHRDNKLAAHEKSRPVKRPGRSLRVCMTTDTALSTTVSYTSINLRKSKRLCPI